MSCQNHWHPLLMWPLLHLLAERVVILSCFTILLLSSEAWGQAHFPCAALNPKLFPNWKNHSHNTLTFPHSPSQFWLVDLTQTSSIVSALICGLPKTDLIARPPDTLSGSKVLVAISWGPENPLTELQNSCQEMFSSCLNWFLITVTEYGLKVV